MKIRQIPVVLAAAVLLGACGPAFAAPQAFRPNTRILFMGDSITQNGWTCADGYVRLVEGVLKELNTGCTVLPGGVSGEKSTEMLKRIDRELGTKRPDIVVFSCGVNDVWHGVRATRNGVSREDYIRNCGEIFDRIVASNATPVVLTPSMIGEKPEERANVILDTYVVSLKELAAARGIQVVDINAAMHAAMRTTPPNRAGRRLTFDGVHMNYLGDRMMARAVLEGFGLAEKNEAVIAKVFEDLHAKTASAFVYHDFRLPFDPVTGFPTETKLPKLPFDLRTARAAGLTRIGGRAVLSQAVAGDWTCDIRGEGGPSGEVVWKYDFTCCGKERPDLAVKVVDPPEPSPLLERITAAGLRLTRTDAMFGFRRFCIDFDGWDGWIVEPKTASLRKDGGWVWCMKWPGAFPEGSGQIDALKRGYYYVYLDNRLWMNEEGTKRAKAWRDLLVTKLGLAPKTFLIGMSWGGFFSTRYAATYPQDVAKVYLDNPLMGFHQLRPWKWPGVSEAWGGSMDDGRDWKADPRMPINLAGPIAAAKIPVLLLYGDKDKTCVPEENCLIFRDAFRKAGADLTVVCRSGKDHHPHGFVDPVDGNKVIDYFEK